MGPPQGGAPPQSLAFVGNHLYYPGFGDPNTIASMSTIDGSITTVLAADAWNLWIEGDHILYFVAGKLSSVPLTGGAPTVLFDANDPNQISIVQTLTATDFYWAVPSKSPDQPDVIWQLSRDTGAAVALVTLPFDQRKDDGSSGRVKTMSATPAGLMIATFGGVGFFFSFVDNALQPLPIANSQFPLFAAQMGVDDGGIVWSVYDPGSKPSWMVRSDVGASATTSFWPAKPDGFVPLLGGGAPEGGWTFVGQEHFAGSVEVFSLWEVAANGTVANRRSCSPFGVAALLPQVMTVSPDAAYVAGWLNDTDAGSPTWQIFKAPRH